MARKKNNENWKIRDNVFDGFTIRNLRHLENQGYFDSISNTIEVGKEANVFMGIKDKDSVIVKIYRLENCNFNKMQQYIATDPRYPNIRPQKRDVIFSWVQREFRNLLVARQAGCRVPTPIINKQNILVEELIGQGNVVALQLKNHVFEDYEELNDCFLEVVNQMKILFHKAELVHADLSEFNILMHENKPVMIDFSQATSTKDNHAKEYLIRDVKNISRFFNKRGLEINKDELLDEILNSKLKKK